MCGEIYIHLFDMKSHSVQRKHIVHQTSEDQQQQRCKKVLTVALMVLLLQSEEREREGGREREIYLRK